MSRSPCYISNLLVPYTPVHTLRSSGRCLLFTPLPEEIRSSESVNSFKTFLETNFYWRAFPDFIWISISLNYLLFLLRDVLFSDMSFLICCPCKALCTVSFEKCSMNLLKIIITMITTFFVMVKRNQCLLLVGDGKQTVSLVIVWCFVEHPSTLTSSLCGLYNNITLLPPLLQTVESHI